MARAALERNGYQVLEAADGDAAWQFSQKYEQPIHLLVTDLVMPQMSGRELAARITSFRPNTRVLYISGSSDDPIAQQRALDRRAALLQKPFTPTILTQKVRDVLVAPPGNGASH